MIIIKILRIFILLNIVYSERCILNTEETFIKECIVDESSAECIITKKNYEYLT